MRCFAKFRHALQEDLGGGNQIRGFPETRLVTHTHFNNVEIRPDIHLDTILQANVRFHWLHSSLTYFLVYSMTLSHSLFISFLTRDRTEEDINFGVRFLQSDG